MKEGEIVLFTYSVVVVLMILCLSILYFWILNRNKQRHYLSEKEVTKNQYQKTLLETKLEVSEQTMKQIAQEIHDHIGQRITLAIQALDMGTSSQGTVKSLLSEALTDLRDLSKSLHTTYIVEMGLDLAIERECEIVSRSSKINCTYHPSDSLPKLSAELELILYRCLQEILNNAVKHSKASEVTVTLKSDELGTELSVHDNGVGFDPSTVRRSVGMNSLDERVKLLKGELSINSVNNSGTAVKIFVSNNSLSTFKTDKP